MDASHYSSSNLSNQITQQVLLRLSHKSTKSHGHECTSLVNTNLSNRITECNIPHLLLHLTNKSTNVKEAKYQPEIGSCLSSKLDFRMNANFQIKLLVSQTLGSYVKEAG